jgi:hypothetical protein
VYEADVHTSLQAAVAIQYGILLGKAVYLLDAERPTEEMANEIVKRLSD